MVSDSTLYTDVWTEIRTILVAAAPSVTSPSAASASINASYNDKASTKPQIVIQPITKEENEWFFGSNQGSKILNVIIDCYGRNSLGADELQQQVEDALKTNAVDGIYLSGITSNYVFGEVNDCKYHLKSTTFTYGRG
jgi:purine nucleoside permease